jgi:hypothetical protein
MDFSGAQMLMSTFNNRFAYVSVSRASHDMQIFTNDAATLAESLSRDVSKASAIDFGKSQNPVASVGVQQNAVVKQTPAAGLGSSNAPTSISHVSLSTRRGSEVTSTLGENLCHLPRMVDTLGRLHYLTGRSSYPPLPSPQQ